MSHPVDIHVGRKLKKLRVSRQLSQTDVARKLEVSFQQIQKYEKGLNRISASRLYEIAKVLEVTPACFFEGFHDEKGVGTAEEPAVELANVLSSIEDDAAKKKILEFIESISDSPLPSSIR